ncbi:NADH-quinone oxidoreductase subunit NuoF [Halanaerobium saccharolyticum]|jgi:NADH:ubiquinone oxidoreductase subunit F (NADH-binding)/(2Fe-2S) ferredoxin|uniref:NADP-reducing hydrogenase subunit HndC n=1 Tax=Halanaerobium saccharolyticum TaxID=43595 RepID=A0A2T5RKQ2_9FIRM|nr:MULTISPECIES: NADH-quinone oxidoreductase subunit NuoF [Halanaerobium]PTV99589.1 NADP-reducing hydrogenase subunit HndC [Halanaerobium saccharolyticum]PUU94110.1 MAG: NADH-quinone oxidoreductase subunit F [Halanaerobium sp.]PUU94821.1 MAG: NADH-quinone oxidoreductase subunit F [Halanaerobium sp.]TDP98253.1 NADP-reducing hydrogenase subunit HndC [Halanaerobium saccharolyticum]
MAKKEILICAGTACLSAGAEEIKDKFKEEIKELNLTEDYETKTVISNTGCIGPCSLGPIAIVKDDNTFYGHLKTEDVARIVREHLLNGRVVEDLLTEEEGEKVEDFKEIRFMKKQKRIALRNTGIIDPNKIEEYLERDGYQALKTVLNELTPLEVIEEIKASGLRGRGGAGFPTGLKWSFAHQAAGEQKYIICNADEGDPGAFMDRSILEGDPHSIIEAMAVAGYAIGADQGFVYVRAEYPLAVKNLKIAIRAAENNGYLGSNIYGSDFSFNLEVRVGAGAFVCGEETALIASIEGKRGQPSTKPPYPANSGLWGKPTVINNVETLANIVPIINKGSQWFSSIGTEKSKGTKVFAVAGDVKETGLVEVPMGTTLREIVFEIAGGIADGKEFKAAQIGGPSGGTIPKEYLDLKIDYESVKEAGAIVGSGGLVIMDEDNSMVDVARFFLDFTEDESCGKCTPCRVGTKRMLDILEKILDGKGSQQDLDKLEELGNVVKETSLCGLGQTAPNPVLSTLKYFREEYEELINTAEEGN